MELCLTRRVYEGPRYGKTRTGSVFDLKAVKSSQVYARTRKSSNQGLRPCIEIPIGSVNNPIRTPLKLLRQTTVVSALANWSVNRVHRGKAVEAMGTVRIATGNRDREMETCRSELSEEGREGQSDTLAQLCTGGM